MTGAERQYSQAKVKVLAEMWRRSGRDTVVYTGAGGPPARPWQIGAKMIVMYYLQRSKKAIQKIAKRHLKTQAHSTNQTIEQRYREKVILHDECYLVPESSAIDLKRAHQQEHDVFRVLFAKFFA